MHGLGRRSGGMTDMRERRLSLDVRMHTALVICLCFLLSSTGWLSWLYHVVTVATPVPVEFLTMACGYVVQALGIGAYILLLRANDESRARKVVVCSLALGLLSLVPATTSPSLAVTLATGYAFNLMCGVLQGHYLNLLSSHVDQRWRGTTFGCAYAASTLATWLLSLPGGGVLTSGLPSLACCLVMGVVSFALVIQMPAVSPQSGTPDAAEVRADTDGHLNDVALVCLSITLASVVRTAGFSFPADDLSGGINLELSRLLYGLGLIAAGIVSDRDRRLGFALCAISLAMPLLMLALSGAGASGMPLWTLGYLLTGIYVLFSVLLTTDGASREARPHLAGVGMMLRHVGDAIGTSLYLALEARPIALIVVTTGLLVVTMALFFMLYQRLFVPAALVQDSGGATTPQAEGVPSERAVFDRFAARHELSLRERDVLRFVLAGKSNAEVAGELHVSERTVKFHVSNLLKKTGCKTRVQIVDLYASER